MPAVESIFDIDSRLANQIVGRRDVQVPHLDLQHVILREARLELEHAAGVMTWSYFFLNRAKENKNLPEIVCRSFLNIL